MPNKIQIKRGSGVPASLAAGELAIDTTNGILYGGDGSAVLPLGGAGAMASVGTPGTYTKVTTDEKGRVTAGTTLSESDIPEIGAAKISDFDSAVRTNRLDQLAAPTAPVSLNGQKITDLADPEIESDGANRGYVDTAINTAVANLINGSVEALDTLQELATALGNDQNFAASITASIGEKLAKSENLADLPNKSASRTNLGLGTMAVQNAASVAITGGTASLANLQVAQANAAATATATIHANGSISAVNLNLSANLSGSGTSVLNGFVIDAGTY